MPLEMLYRYARHARFVDGADEVHRETVARQILKAYEAPENGIPTEHLPTRREARAAEVRDDHRRRPRRVRAVQLVRWQAEPELREIEVPEPAPGEVLVEDPRRGPLPLRHPRHGVPRGDGAVDAPVHLGPRERRHGRRARRRSHRFRHRRRRRDLRAVGLRDLSGVRTWGARTSVFALPGSPGGGSVSASTADSRTTSSSRRRGCSFRSVTSIRCRPRRSRTPRCRRTSAHQARAVAPHAGNGRSS